MERPTNAFHVLLQCLWIHVHTKSPSSRNKCVDYIQGLVSGNSSGTSEENHNTDPAHSQGQLQPLTPCVSTRESLYLVKAEPRVAQRPWALLSTREELLPDHQAVKNLHHHAVIQSALTCFISPVLPQILHAVWTCLQSRAPQIQSSQVPKQREQEHLVLENIQSS